MLVQIHPTSLSGSVKAIASKSAAHRLLICAAFADAPTEILCEELNRDIEATVSCLCALGANIKREGSVFFVTPVQNIPKEAVLPCGESGSTMRFLVPVAAALGVNASFQMEGRLPLRPLSPLREELEAHGIRFSEAGSNPLRMEGTLAGHAFSIAGNVSSQFISGLLFALSLRSEPSELTVIGRVESAPYLDLTADALAAFSAAPHLEDNRYTVQNGGRLISPSHIAVEGDWSNAAFPMAAGAIGDRPVTVFGLKADSHQGDRAIVDLLRQFGASVTEENGAYTVSPAPLHGITIDASQIPDMVPILSVIASVAQGVTAISGASRLRIKESDRLVAICQTMGALGADVTETEDGLVIHGKPGLKGGCVSSFNDHRIAMSAAIAASVCEKPVVLEGAEATAKSYPGFFRDLTALGARITEPS
ncbi:MAG: 3-phosphoshikimate 1-carboxyvinyltransferase [Clostridia bacterium]|nr:3-phosphoshikimate 1-carboxyvinyltransferase [Clostridia bacterium]